MPRPLPATSWRSVVRMPYTVAETEYDAVRFEYHGDGAVSISMFDTATGLLIYYRHTIGTDPTDTQFVGDVPWSRRQLRLPWRGTKAPVWSVAEGDTLDFAGARSIYVGWPAVGPVCGAGVRRRGHGRGALVGLPRAAARPAWPTARSTAPPASPSSAARSGCRRRRYARSCAARNSTATPITGVVTTYARNADRLYHLGRNGANFSASTTPTTGAAALVATRIEVQTGLPCRLRSLRAVTICAAQARPVSRGRAAAEVPFITNWKWRRSPAKRQVICGQKGAVEGQLHREGVRAVHAPLPATGCMMPVPKALSPNCQDS